MWNKKYNYVYPALLSVTVVSLNDPQQAKKLVSDRPVLVDFAIGLVIFALNMPDRQVLFFGKIQITEGL